MPKWLEWAKRQISKSSSGPTAKTDETPVLTVSAVSRTGEIEIYEAGFGSFGSTPDRPFPKIEQPIQAASTADLSRVRAWLSHIGQTDEASTAEVLAKCRADPGALAYFLNRAAETAIPLMDDDNRRYCAQCANLTPKGRCLAAWRGEIMAGRNYSPVPDLLRRCEGYLPKASDPDPRTGRQRWPGLTMKRGNHESS
jgi:hypothetical protein